MTHGIGLDIVRARLVVAARPVLLALVMFALCGARQTSAQDLVLGNYYWYAPEHEKYSRTAFYTEPSFNSPQVRITRTQRFRYGTGRRGWVVLEFDLNGRAYIHVRILRTLLFDPGASDPWYEFRRASVFAEDPAKIEARMKQPAAPPPQPSESKVPIWKRYKDGWNIKPGRSAPVSPETAESTESAAPPRPIEKKSRNRYSPLPPIGSVPPNAAPETPKEGADDTSPAPARQP